MPTILQLLKESGRPLQPHDHWRVGDSTALKVNALPPVAMGYFVRVDQEEEVDGVKMIIKGVRDYCHPDSIRIARDEVVRFLANPQQPKQKATTQPKKAKLSEKPKRKRVAKPIFTTNK